MSKRQIKKLFGNTVPSHADSSDEEYEPHCSYLSKKTNAYEGLEVQSSKPQQEQSGDEATSDIKEKNEPKKKNKNRSQQLKSGSLEVQSSTSKNEQSENEAKNDVKEKNKPKKKNKKKSKQSTSGSMADDIDQIVREVNAMIGEPSPAVNPDNEKKPLEFFKVFSVRKMHLNVKNELNRLLGPDESEGRKKKTPVQRDIVRNQITPLKTSFPRKGLGMDVYDIRDDITFYVYSHSEAYQRQHHDLIDYLGRSEDEFGGPVLASIGNFHVEGMLQAFKLYCESEDYTQANSIIENALAYLQFVADPLFNICNGRTRLEYRFTENRAFHIVVFVYSYLLSNKACHRTALELAKMLINLDPTDPLGVVFVIDIFAIRAREYEWLLKAIEYWEIRDAGHLYNIKYSKALAQFHVSSKKKEDLKQADELLKKALMWFPSGLTAILASILQPTSRMEKLCSHAFFTLHLRIPHVLWDVIKLYGALIGSRWMEQPVLEWLLRNAEELIDMLETDSELKQNAMIIGLKCRRLFANLPTELCRHLIIIKPMSDLIADGLVPSMPVYLNTHYFNPLPVASATVNRYSYPQRP